jgi:hypothetical protein
VAPLSGVEDRRAADADIEVGGTECEVGQDAAGDLHDLGVAVAGQAGNVTAVLVETDPDRVEEQEYGDGDDDEWRSHSGHDRGDPLRDREVHAAIVLPGAAGPRRGRQAPLLDR